MTLDANALPNPLPESAFFEAQGVLDYDPPAPVEKIRLNVTPEQPETAQAATTELDKPMPSLDIDRSPTSRRVLPPSVYAARGRPIHVKEITPEQVENFLCSLAETGLWELSAQREGLSARIIRKLKAVDDDFREMCDQAIGMYVDGVVMELHRRAKEGWDEPVFSHKTGSQIGTIRRYDGKLLELLVKRHSPEFREKFEGEVKITGGVIVVPAAAMDPDSWVKAGQAPRHVQSTVIEPAALPEA